MSDIAKIAVYYARTNITLKEVSNVSRMIQIVYPMIKMEIVNFVPKVPSLWPMDNVKKLNLIVSNIVVKILQNASDVKKVSF